MASPFARLRPLITGASVTFDLDCQDGRVVFDFKGQHVERFSLDPASARAVARALLERADRIDRQAGVVLVQ
jgi:hypothetical protein